MNQSDLPIESTFFEDAAAFARQALCKRARCGAVIVKDGKVVAGGYNAPPLNDNANQKCDYEFPDNRRRPQNDCTCCVHAEWRAIMSGLKDGADLTGSTMYFTRVDENGDKFYSSEKYEPHCTVCSRLALDNGITRWVLWGHPEPVSYEAKHYNDVSYEFHLKAK